MIVLRTVLSRGRPSSYSTASSYTYCILCIGYHVGPEDIPIQRSAIILLNSLVCQAEAERKKRTGKPENITA